MTIGEQIRFCRKAKKISQKKLSELINMTPDTVSNIERNITSPPLCTIKKICDVLALDIKIILK